MEKSNVTPPIGGLPGRPSRQTGPSTADIERLFDAAAEWLKARAALLSMQPPDEGRSR